jgi:hypothetical protein
VTLRTHTLTHTPPAVQVRQLFPSARKCKLMWHSVVKISQSLYEEAPGMDPFRPDQKTPVPNFFLAGSYTKQDYIDSMEGATLSGVYGAACCARRPCLPDVRCVCSGAAEGALSCRSFDTLPWCLSLGSRISSHHCHCKGLLLSSAWLLAILTCRPPVRSRDRQGCAHGRGSRQGAEGQGAVRCSQPPTVLRLTFL